MLIQIPRCFVVSVEEHDADEASGRLSSENMRRREAAYDLAIHEFVGLLL